MKKSKYIILSFILAFVLTGCSDFLDVNVSPDKPVSVVPDQALPVVLFYAAQTQYDHAEYGMYLSQAWTTGGRSQSNSLAYKSGWANFLTMNRHPQWRRHFYDLGVNVLEMNKAADRIASPNFKLIGRTVLLMSTMFTTDMFGDMPYSEAWVAVSPKYDTQESIYDQMHKELDDLIASYDSYLADTEAQKTHIKINKSMDRIYEGDLQKWRSFTYALKARLLLRKLPNMDTSSATCSSIIAAVDKALEDWQEPNYNYDGGSGEKNCPWGPMNVSINSWESRKNDMDKSIITKFLAYDLMGANSKLYRPPYYARATDPRLARIVNSRTGPTGIDAQDTIRFIQSNIGMPITHREVHYPDLYAQSTSSNPFTKNDGMVSLMLTEELLFIKAEAQYWLNPAGVDAYNTTKEAVTHNMIRLGISEGTSGTKDLRTYTYYFESTDAMPASSFNIGHLMRMKYICMYLQPEMWTDMRRYNYSSKANGVQYAGEFIYPNLRRPYNLYEPHWMPNQNVQLDNQIWIQRVNYDPETEEKYNKAELERLGAYKNPLWLRKPMIWAVNPNVNYQDK
ncbi:MAG: SusD/RagB family nutrient-binding outer membrane lipoprotein [Bacteroidales bacterium]